MSSGQSVRRSMTSIDSSSSSAASSARWTARAVGDHGHLLALAGDARLAERHRVLALGDLALDVAVEALVLEVADRVRVADRADQQALGVGGGRRRHDLQPRRLQEPGLRVLGVERAAGEAAARGQADDHRHRDALAVVELRGDVDELVEAAGDEVGELHLADRPHPLDRGADGGADDRVLGERRVEHRSAPNSSMNPSVTLNAPPKAPMSSPRQNTDASRRISSRSAVGDRLQIGHLAHSGGGYGGGGHAALPLPLPWPSATTAPGRRRAAPTRRRTRPRSPSAGRASARRAPSRRTRRRRP